MHLLFETHLHRCSMMWVCLFNRWEGRRSNPRNVFTAAHRRPDTNNSLRAERPSPGRGPGILHERFLQDSAACTMWDILYIITGRLFDGSHCKKKKTIFWAFCNGKFPGENLKFGIFPHFQMQGSPAQILCKTYKKQNTLSGYIPPCTATQQYTTLQYSSNHTINTFTLWYDA